MTPKLKWDDAYVPDRGKVLTAEQLEKMNKFFRYLPEEGTAIPARTLPGVHSKGAFFTRGSGHNKFGGYTEVPDEYQEVMDRLLLKHKEAALYVPAPVIEKRAGAKVGMITIGGCDPAVREALDILEEMGRPMDYMRIKAFPFTAEVEAFLADHDYCYVVEQNRDAQLCSLLTLETPVPKDKIRPILVYSGFPLSAKNVLDVIALRSASEKDEELNAIYS